MTKATEQERAEFEKHILAPNGFFDKGRGWVDRNPDGSYKLTRIQERWLTWQAARRAQAVAVPQGWKLVPDAVNMTDEQAEAVAEIARVCGGGALDIYRAALAAAPQPPEAAQRKPLTVQQYKELHHALFMELGRKPLTDDMTFCRAIERAHGIQ